MTGQAEGATVDAWLHLTVSVTRFDAEYWASERAGRSTKSMGFATRIAALTRSTTERNGVIVPAPHPAEFRQRAVELARRGDQPIAELAQRLQISESCLHRWMLQADIDDNGSDSRLTSVEKRELAQLRRDNRRLHRENQLLKRAVAYFAQDNILGGSSIGQPRSDSPALRGGQCLDALG